MTARATGSSARPAARRRLRRARLRSAARDCRPLGGHRPRARGSRGRGRRLETVRWRARSRTARAGEAESSERADDVVQGVKTLVRNTVLVQVAGEPVAGEHPVGGLSHAAVGVAVADVDDVPVRRQVGALAGLAAGSAGLAVAKTCPPAVRMPGNLVGAHLELEPFALEDRPDQLPEVAGDDRGPVRVRELMETRPQLDMVDQPADHLADRRLDRRRVAANLLVQRNLAPVERRRGVQVDLPDAELAKSENQRVFDGRGPVPVEEDGRAESVAQPSAPAEWETTYLSMRRMFTGSTWVALENSSADPPQTRMSSQSTTTKSSRCLRRSKYSCASLRFGKPYFSSSASTCGWIGLRTITGRAPCRFMKAIVRSKYANRAGSTVPGCGGWARMPAINAATLLATILARSARNFGR